jgi:hypothetical protein
MSKYAIKVVGGRNAGEYDGADTIPAAVRRAQREFVPYVDRNATVNVVRFSKDGLRVIHVRTVKDVPIGGHASRRRRGSRRVCASHGDVHPEFPRVVVYLYRHQGGFRVIVKVKKDYHSLWRTVERGGTTTVAGALAEARAMGRMYERKYKTPEPYELVHGAPGA